MMTDANIIYQASERTVKATTSIIDKQTDTQTSYNTPNAVLSRKYKKIQTQNYVNLSSLAVGLGHVNYLDKL